MALIIDPDFLVTSSAQVSAGVDGNIWIDTATKTIRLREYGDLDQDGVTIQALYSFLKEEWKTDATLIGYPFPMEAITPEQFEFVNGWIPEDQITILSLRNGGFAIKNTDGTSAVEFIGCITLGSLGTTDQVYYQQSISGVAVDVALTGVVNQAIPVYSAVTTSDRSADITYVTVDYDYRGYFKIFVREYQKIYAQAEMSDIGVTTFTYQAYRFPLANADDLKITHTDLEVSTLAPYTNMTIEYFELPQNRTLGMGTYPYSIIVDGAGATKEEIYEFVQWSLRQNTDIDVGLEEVIGKTADGLMRFVGNDLITSTSVFVDNFDAVDTNSITFTDDNGIGRNYPFISIGKLNFNDNLVLDGDAIYRLFYSSTFGTASPVLVKDNNDVAVSGIITTSSVSYSYDYDGDTDGGGAGIDKSVTAVAIGLNQAQYVLATGTIQRSISNSLTLTAALERNYSNPV